MTACDQVASSLIDKLWERPKGQIPELVYHYTDASGLFGMLQSKKVWATDSRFLNDELEGELGVSHAQELVRKLLLNEKSELKRSAYKEFLRALNFKREDRNFVFSLSAKDDDLSQWRMYARDGNGFTIGFKSESILEFSDKTDSFGFSKVFYSRRSFEGRCRQAIDLINESLFENLEKVAPDSGALKNAAANLEWIISSSAVLYKHSSFQAEREWRVNTYKDSDNNKNPVKVRASGYRLIPYMQVELCSVDQGCLPIARIGIGPGFKQSSTRYAIERLCDMNELSVEIYDADTPFRRI